MPNDIDNLHSVIGGMTTDYFDFWCQDCVEHIDRLSYYGPDIVGVQLEARCKKCNKSHVFKINVFPSLVPASDK